MTTAYSARLLEAPWCSRAVETCRPERRGVPDHAAPFRVCPGVRTAFKRDYDERDATAGMIVMKGSGLGSEFPVGTPVSIRIVSHMESCPLLQRSGVAGFHRTRPVPYPDQSD